MGEIIILSYTHKSGSLKKAVRKYLRKLSYDENRVVSQIVKNNKPTYYQTGIQIISESRHA